MPIKFELNKTFLLQLDTMIAEIETATNSTFVSCEYIRDHRGPVFCLWLESCSNSEYVSLEFNPEIITEPSLVPGLINNYNLVLEGIEERKEEENVSEILKPDV